MANVANLARFGGYVNILIQDIIQFFCVVCLFALNMIGWTVNRHELGTP